MIFGLNAFTCPTFRVALTLPLSTSTYFAYLKLIFCRLPCEVFIKFIPSINVARNSLFCNVVVPTVLPEAGEAAFVKRLCGCKDDCYDAFSLKPSFF